MPFLTPIHTLHFVALDLETTGLVPGFDAITEIGAARFSLKKDGTVIPGEVFEELVNPEREISTKVAQLTGIDDAMVKGARPLGEVLPDFMRFIEESGPSVLIAHNARFDVGFLNAGLVRLGIEEKLPPAACTVRMAKRALPGAPRYGLIALMEWLSDHDEDRGESVHHRALPDALHARNLFAHCVRRVGAERLRDLGVQAAIVSERVTSDPVEIPEHMVPLETAIDQGLPVDLNYRGGSKGRRRRPVKPLALFMQDATLYLRATCLVDQQDKSFRADRIRAVHPHWPSTAAASDRED